ncbi:IS21 family transposase, partial [Dethiobacter alkaliphilus]|nr:IS21 family transposase [Dethiobacter alkaliphilus]
QEFLEGCERSDKGKVLRAIAALTENSNFESAVKTIETALMYDAFDTDSLMNLHRRIHGGVRELPPLSLGDKLPRLTPVNPNLDAYDAGLTRRGGVSQC